MTPLARCVSGSPSVAVTGAGNDSSRQAPAAATLPAVRSRGPHAHASDTAEFGQMPTCQDGAGSKRARVTDSATANPEQKRRRTDVQSDAAQTDLQAYLLDLPDDVLRQIAPRLRSADDDPLVAMRTLLWFKASCKALRQRMAGPEPQALQELKYQHSCPAIQKVLNDPSLAPQQVVQQVQVLCERYGDVKLQLHNRGKIADMPENMRNRNQNALAGIAAAKTIRSLKLDVSGARDITNKDLCSALQHDAPARVSLTARHMAWGNGKLAALFDTIGQSKGIVYLCISGTGGPSGSSFRFMEQGGWGPGVVRALDSMLRRNQSLEVLDVSSLPPGDSAACSIAKALTVNRALTDLRLASNDLSLNAVQAMGRALGDNSTLTALDLGWNCLDQEGVQGLVDGLRKNNALSSLKLPSCELSDALALALVSLFEHNVSLRALDLGNNVITASGTIGLMRAFQDKPHLHSLALYGNLIGLEGAAAIGQMLGKNAGLEILDLSACGMGDEGLAKIAQGLCNNAALRHLILGGTGSSGTHNHVTSTGVAALAGALKTHPSIQSLCLRGISIKTTSAQALARLLRIHPTLAALNLTGCSIGSKDKALLAGAVKSNMRLVKVVY